MAEISLRKIDDLRDEEVIIVSSDSDMIQVIQNLSAHNIKLYNPRLKSFVEAPPYVYLVWKSIAGDISDNIPSIASAKKAELYANNPDALRDFLAIEENRANFSLNKKLIELRLVASNELIFTEYKIDFDLLFREFEKLDFSSLLKETYREKFVETFTDCLI